MPIGGKNHSKFPEYPNHPFSCYQNICVVTTPPKNVPHIVNYIKQILSLTFPSSKFIVCEILFTEMQQK
jgi:hypothetical protein